MGKLILNLVLLVILVNLVVTTLLVGLAGIVESAESPGVFSDNQGNFSFKELGNYFGNTFFVLFRSSSVYVSVTVVVIYLIYIWMKKS
ncbi:MAG: hypothetical protein KDK36_06190 [Leptospiraceae bacterium]|nr:hypothetical protein [Leptospiraceae bacterium]